MSKNKSFISKEKDKNYQKDLQSLFDEELARDQNNIVSPENQNGERKNKLNKRRRRSKKHQELLAQGLLDKPSPQISTPISQGKKKKKSDGYGTISKPKNIPKPKPIKFPQEKQDNASNPAAKDKKSTTTAVKNVNKPNKFPVLDTTPGKFPCRQNIEGMNFTTSPKASQEYIHSPFYKNIEQMFNSKFDSLMPFEMEFPVQDDEGLIHKVSDRPLGTSLFHALNQPYIHSGTEAIKTDKKQTEKPTKISQNETNKTDKKQNEKATETFGNETQTSQATRSDNEKTSELLPVKEEKVKQTSAAKKKKRKAKSAAAAAAIASKATPNNIIQVGNKFVAINKANDSDSLPENPAEMKIFFTIHKPIARAIFVRVLNAMSEIHIFFEYPAKNAAGFYGIGTNQMQFESVINFYVADRGVVLLKVEGEPFASEVLYDMKRIHSFTELKDTASEKRLRAVIQTNPQPGTELKAHIKIRSGSNRSELILFNHSSSQTETATKQIVRIDVNKAAIKLEKAKESQELELQKEKNEELLSVEVEKKELNSSSIDEKLAGILGVEQIGAIRANSLKEKMQTMSKKFKLAKSAMLSPIAEELTAADNKVEECLDGNKQVAIGNTSSPTPIAAQVVKALVIKDGERRVRNVLVGNIPPGDIAKLILDNSDSCERQDLIQALKREAKKILLPQAQTKANNGEKIQDSRPNGTEQTGREVPKIEIHPVEMTSEQHKALQQALHKTCFTRIDKGKTKLEESQPSESTKAEPTNSEPQQTPAAKKQSQIMAAIKKKENLNLNNILAELAPPLIKDASIPNANEVSPFEKIKLIQNNFKGVFNSKLQFQNPQIEKDSRTIPPTSEIVTPLSSSIEGFSEQRSEEDSSAVPMTEDNLSLFNTLSQGTEFVEAGETEEDSSSEASLPSSDSSLQYFDAVSDLSQLTQIESFSDSNSDSSQDSMSEYFDALCELSDNSEGEIKPVEETKIECFKNIEKKNLQYFEVSSGSTESRESDQNSSDSCEAAKSMTCSKPSRNLSATSNIEPRSSAQPTVTDLSDPESSPDNAALKPTSTSKSPAVFRNVTSSSPPVAESRVASNCEIVANQTILKQIKILDCPFHPTEQKNIDDKAEGKEEDEDSCDSDKTLVNSENK